MTTSRADTVTTLDDARNHIRELEASLNGALDLIVRRDDELQAAERRLLRLEHELVDARAAKPG